MKGQKVYTLALLKLIGAYALFTGIIASVFLFFIVMPQQKSLMKTPTPTPTVLPSPQSTPKAQGKFCGGIGAIQCPTGYTCKAEGTYPDAGGTCIKKK